VSNEIIDIRQRQVVHPASLLSGGRRRRGPPR
jgi:hypothetical protein